MNGNLLPTEIKSNAPQVLHLIYTETELAGDGKSMIDPVRRVKQVHTLDGQLLVSQDEYRCFSAKNVMDALAHIRSVDMAPDLVKSYLIDFRDQLMKNHL